MRRTAWVRAGVLLTCVAVLAGSFALAATHGSAPEAVAAVSLLIEPGDDRR